MWGAMTIRMVEAGTEFENPDGSRHIVTDNNAVANGRTLYVTERIFDEIKARSVRRTGQGGGE